MIKIILAGALALAVGVAVADGVPLITAGPAALTSAPSLQRAAAEPSFVKAHPITFNKNAFGSNVITVTIDGQEHRFAGRMNEKPARATPPKPPASGATPLYSQRDFDSWTGSESGRFPGTLVVTRETATGIIVGVISLDGRTFEIKPLPGAGVVMIETNRAGSARPVLATRTTPVNTLPMLPGGQK